MEPNQATHSPIPGWASIVRALPTPAALVDPNGVVLVSGRWIEQESGDQLVRINGYDAAIANGADGTSRWRIQPLDDQHGVLLATLEDLDGDYELLSRLFATAERLFAIYDQAGKVIHWNSSWTQKLGYTDDQMLGLDSWSLLPLEDSHSRAATRKELREHGRSEQSWPMRAADGSYRLIRWILQLDEATGRCIGVGSDASLTATASAELERRAYTDDLTGLANRAHTVATLGKRLEGKGTPALLFCDLDQFKVVNDSLGHSIGDLLLSALGERLASYLDSPNLTVGRLGGDEFAVVIGDGGLAAAEAAASTIFDAIREEFRVGGRSVQIGLSVGICVAEPNVETAERMFERADMAVYQAKDTGRNRTVVYGPDLQERVDRRFEIETSLRRGLDLEEFEPWFQPIVDITINRIIGFEALLRWRRGTEILAPGAFQDIAMETGLITPIGRQMIARALTEFSSMTGIAKDAFLTLNVSARELAHSGFTDWFIEQVGAAGLRASQIVVEITESVAIEEHSLSDYLAVLRALGFRIALDDFGTGHSSLSHLRTLPIDIVKIDRTFVADLIDDQTTSALTRSIVELCEALSLSVIFEGIETKPESEAVRQVGGQWVQGFLYSKALPINELQWRTVSAELSRRIVEREQSQSAKPGT